MLTITSPVHSLVFASSLYNRNHAILSQWTQTLCQLEPNYTPQDGLEGLEVLKPPLSILGEHMLVADLNAEGIKPWLDLNGEKRDVLIHRLAPHIKPSEALILQNEAMEIEKSLAKTRPLTFAVIGKQNPASEQQEEAVAILDHEFRYGAGRGLLLEEPATGSLQGSHKLFYPGISKRTNPQGLQPLSMQSPLRFGALSIGALAASSLPDDLQAAFPKPHRVDIVLVSGVMDPDGRPYVKLMQHFSSSLLLIRSDDPNNRSFLEWVGKDLEQMILHLAPARSAYALITFHPTRQQIEVETVWADREEQYSHSDFIIWPPGRPLNS